jgi:hypothetical protein
MMKERYQVTTSESSQTRGASVERKKRGGLKMDDGDDDLRL